MSKDEIVLEETGAPLDEQDGAQELPGNPPQEAQPNGQDDCPQVQDLRRELQEQSEKYLRLAAEYDNFRKRTAREREQQTDFVVADTVARFLPVIDSLHLAGANRGGNAEDVQLGLEKILQSMADTMSALGLAEIDTSGAFDPNLHNAVLHVEDESLPKNSIVEVFQRGYLYRDRVVRHAMVSVAN